MKGSGGLGVLIIMAAKVLDLSCRNCGATADVGQTRCNYCKQPIMISTFNSVFSMPMPLVNQFAATYREALKNEPDAKDMNSSVAMCYLKLKLYDKALAAFEKAIEDNFDNSEIYFYAAICLLNGKKAFLAQRAVIDKIEEYINAALAIEPKGIYYYFWAYIKYDYFSRKSLNTTPPYQEALSIAKSSGVASFDIEQLYGVLGVSRPEVI